MPQNIPNPTVDSIPTQLSHIGARWTRGSHEIQCCLSLMRMSWLKESKLKKKRRIHYLGKYIKDKKDNSKPKIKIKTQDSKTQTLMTSPSQKWSLHWQMLGEKEHVLIYPLELTRSQKNCSLNCCYNMCSETLKAIPSSSNKQTQNPKKNKQYKNIGLMK